MRRRSVYLKPNALSEFLGQNFRCMSGNFKPSESELAEAYQVLGVPLNSEQSVVREAFIQLAKKFHPDADSPEASIQKFVTIENAFRLLSSHHSGGDAKKEVDEVVSQIRHTVPQHRQYLSFDGVGYGTPSQREKQWAQARAQRAADNVMEHRVAKAYASDNTLMKKDEFAKQKDIKTKLGFDRLVEDLIQESISKGEFENLSGKGKPLKEQNTNPYVDFTTHKLNEVLINNGFTPEWITMSKEIDNEIEVLRRDIETERMYLGPAPLSKSDSSKWKRICKNNANVVKTINARINNYNLIVPLINKQKFHVDLEALCADILKNGQHSVKRKAVVDDVEKQQHYPKYIQDDLFGIFFRGLSELLKFKKS